MRTMQLPVAIIAALLASCTAPPTGIASVGWTGLDQLEAADQWQDLPPPVMIDLARPSKVTVQFQGEFAPARTWHPVGTAVAPLAESVPVSLRIVVADKVAIPEQLAGGGGAIGATAPISHGMIAVIDQVPAGQYLVQVQWRSAVTGARALNRGIVVWTADSARGE